MCTSPEELVCLLLTDKANHVKFHLFPVIMAAKKSRLKFKTKATQGSYTVTYLGSNPKNFVQTLRLSYLASELALILRLQAKFIFQ